MIPPEGGLVSDARARTPKVMTDRADVRGIPLSPVDGFVLSRIDGASDEHEIIAVTGLPPEQVQASLAKLESLGVIMFNGAHAPAAAIAPRPLHSAISLGLPPPPDDLTALAEDVDLDVEMRHQILRMHAALERSDHYALLGVDTTADKKTLRRAYFELAAKFHPDRYFRKKLGSFKPRMETIFGRLTRAHDTVSNKESRAEYDAYLEERSRARGIEDLLADALDEVKRAEESVEREVRAQTPLAAPSSSSAPPPRSVRPPDLGAPRLASPAPYASPFPLSPIDVAARRDALARRLLGARGPASSSAPPPRISVVPAPTPTVAEAMDALRRRYEERLTRAKAAQARRYVANGEAALVQGDPVSAANAFRVALSLSPTDPSLERVLGEAQGKADAVLSETYARQAGYEEKTGQWAGAARSWTRVCKARPNDADAHEHASNAIVKAGGDLHEAGKLAERACAMEPKTARYRMALANVYFAAGLTLNARRELEAATQLAPHDDTIETMLRKLGSKA
jgi:tetratricopeptide (TPR) repeat protein